MIKNFLEGYEPNTKDEERFIKKHKVQKHADRNGNGDDVFQATNVKRIDRNEDRHGYNPGQDEAVSEEVQTLEEKTLKPGQKIHRQELAKLIRKANPHIDPGQAYAMAVATAERVNESVSLLESEKTDGYWITDHNYEITHSYPFSNKTSAHNDAKSLTDNTGRSHTVTHVKGGKVITQWEHDAGTGKVRSHTSARGEDFEPLEESVDQLDELSHSTLKSYVNKTSNDRTKQLNNSRKYNNRMNGSSKAISKLKNKGMSLSEAKSPAAGMRLVSKHEGKDGHHAEVRHNKDWDEFQVHHYHNGEHLGEGPVSYHDSKAEAKEAAEHAVKNFVVKGKKLVSEEQLDELSKGLVKKYIGHATADLETNKRVLAATAKKTGRSLDDVYDDPKSANLTKRQYNRYRGIDTATGKIQPNDRWTKVRATNESEQLEEKTLTPNEKKKREEIVQAIKRENPDMEDGKAYAIAASRAKKLVEDEELNEISKDKMKKYVRRAAHDIEDRAYWEGRDDADERPYGGDRKKSNQRHKGIRTALKKLTKEDIINSAITKYLPEVPKSSEDVFESRVQRLPEQHQQALSDLFNTLSEANKLSMLDQMLSEEGCNELLDFAIQARNA